MKKFLTNPFTYMVGFGVIFIWLLIHNWALPTFRQYDFFDTFLLWGLAFFGIGTILSGIGLFGIRRKKK